MWIEKKIRNNKEEEKKKLLQKNNKKALTHVTSELVKLSCLCANSFTTDILGDEKKKTKKKKKYILSHPRGSVLYTEFLL